MEENNVRQQSGRTFIFTLFGYELYEREPRLQAWLAESCRYAIYGREVCPDTGRQHLQGYLALPRVRRIGPLVRHLRELLELQADRAAFYLAPACGTAVENRDYCSKDGNVWTCGVFPNPGRRNDIIETAKRLRELSDFDAGYDDEENLAVLARFPEFCRHIYQREQRRKAQGEVQCHIPFEWQARLERDLDHPPDPRQIAFVVDERGEGGKTVWCLEYLRRHPETTELWGPGTTNDIAYALEGKPVQLHDIPRDSDINYSVLEQSKNGYIWSPKFHSKHKQFPQPHVVVFVNVHPDRGKLSADRFNVTVI